MTDTARMVEMGETRYEFPSATLQPLVDSTPLLDDHAALRSRFHTDGYLYLPGLIDRSTVLAARTDILESIDAQNALAPGTEIEDAVIASSGATPRLMGRPEVTHLPSVLAVLEHEALVDLCTTIHDEPVAGFDYKWLRAVGTGQFTGVHLDRVYMGRGSRRLMTTWVPFGDIPLEMGSLAVCPGSHRDDRFARVQETYGQIDVDRDRIEGWLTTDPDDLVRRYGAVWHTGDVRAGDVIAFGMGLLHASTTNTTDRWRISCDVRFQPAADPVDERWVGAEPIGHDPATFDPNQITSMADARARWGI